MLWVSGGLGWGRSSRGCAGQPTDTRESVDNSMSDLCRLIWCALIGLFGSRTALEAEILVLRHQLNVLQRKSPIVAIGPAKAAKNSHITALQFD
jgi:hypothetical protein